MVSPTLAQRVMVGPHPHGPRDLRHHRRGADILPIHDQPSARLPPPGFHHRLFGRDASPAEPPPGELGRLGFTADC